MRTQTYKSSLVIVACGKKTKVFKSVEEVPADMRERLRSSTSGRNSRTLLIADARGREEIARALQGKPSCLPRPLLPERAAALRQRRRRANQRKRIVVLLALLAGGALLVLKALALYWVLS